MINKEKFEGIKFEWRGNTLTSWGDKGLDCFGLANYIRIDSGLPPLPFDIYSYAEYNRDTIPRSFVYSEFEANPHAFLVNTLPSADFDIVLVSSSRSLVGIGTYHQGKVLAFGADNRSHWMLPVEYLSILHSTWVVAI